VTYKHSFLLALLLTLGIIVVFYSLLPVNRSSYAQDTSPTCTVPDVLELPEAYASIRITEAGFPTPTVVMDTDTFIAAGHVITQSLSAGNTPSCYEEIEITIKSDLSPNSGLSPTLEEVQKRGYLRCGINEGLAYFSEPKGESASDEETGRKYYTLTLHFLILCLVPEHASRASPQHPDNQP
jgi:hypothetical protein